MRSWALVVVVGLVLAAGPTEGRMFGLGFAPYKHDWRQAYKQAIALQADVIWHFIRTFLRQI